MNATLNITYMGQNGDLADPLPYDTSDTDVLRVASEAVRAGSVVGITADPDANLLDFVVDRFPEREDSGARLMIRPKTPFGF